MKRVFGPPHRWGTWALTIAMLCGLTAAARGQQFQPAASAAEGPLFQAQAPTPPTQATSFEGVSIADPVPPPPSGEVANIDLSQRVADLEKRLADIAKQSAAPKATAPNRPTVVPSGRIQFDAAAYHQNTQSVTQFGDIRDAVGFRRARLALLGEYQQFDYIIEMDFANRGANAVINSKDQSVAFKDVYIQMRDLPLIGNVRVGHYKECFGLEDLTSDNYTTFMERTVNDEGTFAPGRNNGIMAFNWTENQRATWAAGVFTGQTGFDQPPTAQFDHWGLDFATRGTFLPWYDEDSNGRGYLHTGAGYAYRRAADNIGIFATRPESAFAPAIINMRLTDVEHWQVFGTEGLLVYGPLSFQSEFFAASVDRLAAAPTSTFYGTYAFVSYFLTGEHRPYNRKLGLPDRVRPYENFFRVRTGDEGVTTGRGAWEIGYRISYIDMLDNLETTKGAGFAATHTIGLNWYLNPYARLMFNYIRSMDTYVKTDGTHAIADGTIDAFMVRAAMDF